MICMMQEQDKSVQNLFLTLLITRLSCSQVTNVLPLHCEFSIMLLFCQEKIK